jgi:hypothetical protein
MYSKLINSIILLLFPFFLLAQTQKEFEVSGIIGDLNSKQAIPYATISIKKMPQDSLVIGGISKIDGHFEIQLNADGEYKLSVSSVGYQAFSELFSLSEMHSKANLGHIFMPSDTVNIRTIDVVAYRDLVKCESNKLIYNVESDPEAPTLDGSEILERVPSLMVTPSKILVNGKGNVKILINGRLSNIASKNPSEYLQNIPANRIKSIEVVNNPGAKYDAEGTDAVINIVMKKIPEGYTFAINNKFTFYDKPGLRGGLDFSMAFRKFSAEIDLSDKVYIRIISRENSTRVNYNSENTKYVNRMGTSGFNFYYLPMTADFNYEIDSLNLINLTLSSYYDRYQTDYMANVELKNYLEVLNSAYSLNSSYVNFEKNYTGVINYQKKSAKDPNRILTLSYQFVYTPLIIQNEFIFDSVFNYESEAQRLVQNDKWIEQTAQIDYTYPFSENSFAETGVKYISRRDDSYSIVADYLQSTNTYVDDNNAGDDFKYK